MANDHAGDTAQAVAEVVPIAYIPAPENPPRAEFDCVKKTLLICGGNASNQKPNNTILAQAAFESPEEFAASLNNRPLGSPAEHFLCGMYADGKGREEGSEPELMWGIALDFDVLDHHKDANGNGKMPAALREKAEDLILAGDMPGNAVYLTPGGIRPVVIFNRPVSVDAWRRYSAYYETVAREYLKRTGLDQDLKFDGCSTRPKQPFYTPRSLVKGAQREEVVDVLTFEPTYVSDLEKLAPSASASSAPVAASSPSKKSRAAKANGTLAAAVEAYRADHKLSYLPKKNRMRNCPVCFIHAPGHGKRTSMRVEDNEERFVCFGDTHKTTGIGNTGDKGAWVFDALDVAVYELHGASASKEEHGRRRIDLLVATGYLKTIRPDRLATDLDGQIIQPDTEAKVDYWAAYRAAEKKWLADNTPTWPPKATPGTCPACGAIGTFYTEDGATWTCLNPAHHRSKAGRPGKPPLVGWGGDVWDLACAAKRGKPKTRTQLLKEGEYLDAGWKPAPAGSEPHKWAYVEECLREGNPWWQYDTEAKAWVRHTAMAMQLLLGLGSKELDDWQQHVHVCQGQVKIWGTPPLVVEQNGARWVTMKNDPLIQPEGDVSLIQDTILAVWRSITNNNPAAYDFALGWESYAYRAYWYASTGEDPDGLFKGKPRRPISMRTMPLFCGKQQGTGKNLSHDCVLRDLYGRKQYLKLDNEDLGSVHTADYRNIVRAFGDELLAPDDVMQKGSKQVEKTKKLITNSLIDVRRMFRDKIPVDVCYSISGASNNVARPVAIDSEFDRRFSVIATTKIRLPTYLGPMIEADAEAHGPMLRAFAKFLLEWPVAKLVRPGQQLVTSLGRDIAEATSSSVDEFIREIRRYGVDAVIADAFASQLMEGPPTGLELRWMFLRGTRLEAGKYQLLSEGEHAGENAHTRAAMAFVSTAGLFRAYEKFAKEGNGKGVTSKSGLLTALKDAFDIPDDHHKKKRNVGSPIIQSAVECTGPFPTSNDSGIQKRMKEELGESLAA